MANWHHRFKKTNEKKINRQLTVYKTHHRKSKTKQQETNERHGVISDAPEELSEAVEVFVY